MGCGLPRLQYRLHGQQAETGTFTTTRFNSMGIIDRAANQLITAAYTDNLRLAVLSQFFDCDIKTGLLQLCEVINDIFAAWQDNGIRNSQIGNLCHLTNMRIRFNS